MKASEGETADRITNSRGNITLLVIELNETKLLMNKIRNMRNG